MKITKVNISKRRENKLYINIFYDNRKIYAISEMGYWWKYEFDLNQNSGIFYE